MATSTGQGWAQLRQQARGFETQTETLFHALSQIAALSTGIPPKPSADETRTVAGIQDILQKREALLTSLNSLLNSGPSSALKTSNLSRHQEILTTHRHELSRLTSSIAMSRDRANLLSNVRSDISSYRENNPETAEADYMLDERSRLDNSHNMADSVLGQAYAVNEGLRVQAERMKSVYDRMGGVARTLPGVNGLIGRIGKKKRRDGIILGSFIAFCFLMVFWST